ncbi:hypothetical protein, partial [Burkholderia pseudomallei]|uniref:hypothetical protein n=1 Tax=Burkholderia pseudomallei TaxID=28450 RepID=UPI0027E1FAB1
AVATQSLREKEHTTAAGGIQATGNLEMTVEYSLRLHRVAVSVDTTSRACQHAGAGGDFLDYDGAFNGPWETFFVHRRGHAHTL